MEPKVDESFACWALYYQKDGSNVVELFGVLVKAESRNIEIFQKTGKEGEIRKIENGTRIYYSSL